MEEQKGESLTACLSELQLSTIRREHEAVTRQAMSETWGYEEYLLELVRQLRQRKYAGKIVVLSAHLSPENIGTYEELAVDEIVGKPYDSTELRKIIGSLEEEI